MTKFDQRVRELVAEELTDIRALFLDVEKVSTDQGSSTSGGFGQEGVKPQLLRVEQMVSKLYTHMLKEKVNEDQEEDNEEFRQIVDELIAEPYSANDDNSPAADKLFKWLEDYHPDININLPFSGNDELSASDLAINQGIRMLPIPKKFRALGMLLFGAGKKLVGKLSEEQLKWMIWDLIKWSDGVRKEIKRLILKMEDELKEHRASDEFHARELSDQISQIQPPQSLTNNSLTLLNTTQAIQAQVHAIRRLL